jgi:TrmH family RNA methyltransferase
MPITSSQNDKLKIVRKLHGRRRDRDHLGQFVAEGEDLLAAADAAGWVPIDRFATTGSGLPGTEVDAKVLASVTALASGARTLAIYKQNWVAAPMGPLCVYLHGVSDPGNVGTVLRSAAAFGVSSVALGPDSADPFGPRAVRASMGGIFQVPVVRAEPSQLPGTTIALDADATATLADVAGDLGQRAEVSILVGAERDGLPLEVLKHADHVARIPIRTESLNAAMAATIALYELARRIKPA